MFCSYNYRPTRNPTPTPTTQPTSFPTYDLSVYSESSLYLNYTSEVAESDMPIMFSTFSYKDTVIEGTCGDWKYFVENGFDMPVETLQIGSIMMSTRTDNPDQSVYDPEYDTANLVQCSDMPTVEYLIRKIRTGERAFAYCGANQAYWRVFQCSGETVVCVNCAHNECEVCPSTPDKMFVIPCSVDSCDTGKSGYTLLSFGTVRKILFPIPVYEINATAPIIHAVTKDSALVTQNI